MPKPKNGPAKVPKKPSPRRLKLAKILLANTGKSLKQAMIEAGYGKGYAKNSQDLKKTKGWDDLLEQYLPDTKILKNHDELLTSVRIDNYVFSNALTDKQIAEVIANIPGGRVVKITRSQTAARAYFTVPDNHSKKDGVDMAYKLKGSYKAEKVEHTLSEEVEAALNRMAEILPKSK